MEYTVSGMTDLRHRLKFVYKKPGVVPGKSGPLAQERFVEQYQKRKENKVDSRYGNLVYFMPGTHPQHNTMPAYGWIKQGEAKEIKANAGRKRFSINGALNIEEVTRFNDSINAQFTLALLCQSSQETAILAEIFQAHGAH